MADGQVGLDHHVGHLVDNPMQPDWGPGLVVGSKGRNVFVVFRDQPGQKAKLMVPDGLRRAASQSDPILETVPEHVMERGRCVPVPGEKTAKKVKKKR